MRWDADGAAYITANAQDGSSTGYKGTFPTGGTSRAVSQVKRIVHRAIDRIAWLKSAENDPIG